MVRLVFRPYTQVKRTICTSVSLRSSTRVSPGFNLLRHSSPSFGSQQVCSDSNLSQAIDRSMVPRNHSGCRFPPQRQQGRLYFHCASGFTTQILAYVLDSLVRVSRRVKDSHFVSIPNAQLPDPHQQHATPHDIALLSRTAHTLGHRRCAIVARVDVSPQSGPRYLCRRV
jgi:hypothetical protein